MCFWCCGFPFPCLCCCPGCLLPPCGYSCSHPEGRAPAVFLKTMFLDPAKIPQAKLMSAPGTNAAPTPPEMMR